MVHVDPKRYGRRNSHWKGASGAALCGCDPDHCPPSMSKSSVLSTKLGFSKARLLTLKCSRTFIGETRDGADHLASHQLDEVIAKVKDSLIEVWAIRLPQGLGPQNATRACRTELLVGRHCSPPPQTALMRAAYGDASHASKKSLRSYGYGKCVIAYECDMLRHVIAYVCLAS